MEPVSFAELREPRKTKLFTLAEEGQFGRNSSQFDSIVDRKFS